MAPDPQQQEILDSLCRANENQLLFAVLKQAMLVQNAIEAGGSGGSGITQLTGDVTAGPGSGSVAATVVAINGVAISGTPSIGQTLVATSTSAAHWATVAATVPGGATTNIQFNDAGSFGGDADFTWNKTSNTLTIAGAANNTSLIVTGGLVSGANTTAAVSITDTWNTSGAAIGVKISITETAVNSAGRLLQINGGTLGNVEQFGVLAGNNGIRIKDGHGLASEGTGGMSIMVNNGLNADFTSGGFHQYSGLGIYACNGQPGQYLEINHNGTDGKIFWSSGHLDFQSAVYTPGITTTTGTIAFMAAGTVYNFLVKT